ncbi:MAG: cell division protein FtsW [Bacteroidetes bacterium]|nr:MAG: cell division protein FtsW [Bacteroidota bacterium]
MLRRNHIDLTLLLTVLTLMFMSIGVVYSASAAWAFKRYGETEYMLLSHAGKVVFGLLALLVGINLDYKKVKHLSKLGILIAVGLLGATLLSGVVAKGATRWLLGFQPSEFAKFALLFHVSALIAVKGEEIRDFKKGFLQVMMWIVLITVLVLAQPNFSMGALIFGLGILMIFIAGARLTHLLSMFLAGIPALLLYMWIAPYRRQRIFDFLSGGSGKTSYQLLQSKIAFGVGGLLGVGAGDSHQRDFFLPESYGDFVYAIIGEEYGLLGTVIVLVLFLVIMYRGFRIAKASEDMFGKYLAIAITSAITLFALVNAGVTVGLLPTTGLPMPFVSYGGSSMVFSAFAIGLLLNISSQTDMFPREHKPAAIQPVTNGHTSGSGVGKVY